MATLLLFSGHITHCNLQAEEDSSVQCDSRDEFIDQCKRLYLCVKLLGTNFRFGMRAPKYNPKTCAMLLRDDNLAVHQQAINRRDTFEYPLALWAN